MKEKTQLNNLIKKSNSLQPLMWIRNQLTFTPGAKAPNNTASADDNSFEVDFSICANWQEITLSQLYKQNQNEHARNALFKGEERQLRAKIKYQNLTIWISKQGKKFFHYIKTSWKKNKLLIIPLPYNFSLYFISFCLPPL